MSTILGTTSILLTKSIPLHHLFRDTIILSTAFLLSTPVLLGALSTILFGRRYRAFTRPPGLLFHSVVPHPGLEMSHVAQHRFERFCSLLAATNLTALPLTEAAVLNATTDGSALDNCLLTFDDGFKSVLTSAAPILRQYGHKATIFCLGNHFGALSQWDIFSGNQHLTKSDIRTLSEMGHEIGSHSQTHAYLPFLDNKEVRRELALSKEVLEDIVGKPVTSLSFPYGGWNRRIWEIAREEGYTAATLYRGTSSTVKELFPVYGVYRNDRPEDMLAKLTDRSLVSPLRARARMMSHFARGTPVWKYRPEYHINRLVE